MPERRAALEQLVLHATSLRIPVVEVEGGTLTRICGFDGHQGVALVVEPRRWATLDEVLGRARERGEPPFVLVLDSLEDPQNVGTLLRSAEACGVHGVLFPTRRSAPISPAAVKASAGAIEHLLLVPLDDLGGGLVDLRGRGLRIVGADEEAALPYRDADYRGPLALVVGSEAHGISGHIRRRIDLAVRIPMRGRVASLNASVAGSVLLFEAASQRGGMTLVRRHEVADAGAVAPEPGRVTEGFEHANGSADTPEGVEHGPAAGPEPGGVPSPEPGGVPSPEPGTGPGLEPGLLPAPSRYARSACDGSARRRSRPLHRRRRGLEPRRRHLSFPPPDPSRIRRAQCRAKRTCSPSFRPVPSLAMRSSMPGPSTPRSNPRGATRRAEPLRCAHRARWGILHRRADVAQLVEQRFCKPPVPGSSPVVGSKRRGRLRRASLHHGGAAPEDAATPWVG